MNILNNKSKSIVATLINKSEQWHTAHTYCPQGTRGIGPPV